MLVILALIVSFLQIAVEKCGIDLAVCQWLIHLYFTWFHICCLSRCLVCTTPVEALRCASKCNTIPEKQHDLLNNTVENNIIMKLLMFKINPTT
jgi:hypothetical protein